MTANDHAAITLNAMKRAIEMSGGGNNGETPPQLREISFLNDKERTFQIDNVSVNESNNKEDLKTKHPSLHEFLTRANEGGDLSRYEDCDYVYVVSFVNVILSLSFLSLCVDARYLFQCTHIIIIVIVRSFVHIPRAQARTRLDDPGKAFRRAAAPFSARFVRLARVENVANIRSHAE